MPQPSQYLFFRIPKDRGLPTSVEKYKELRLHALKIAPSSFSSTVEIESALSDIEWTARLTADKTETFICASVPVVDGEQQHPTGKSAKSLDSAATWVGQVTLRGPLSSEEFALPEESGQKYPSGKHGEFEEGEEERWQMLSLFTHPEYRGQGLGLKLCQEALNYLKSYRDDPPVVRVRLMVKPDNHATVGLYKKLGFEETGKCTLAEAVVANGDAALLPKDISGAKYTVRSGLIMTAEIPR